MLYFQRLLASCAIIAATGCAGMSHGATPGAPGASIALARHHYFRDIYKAPAGSRVYAVKIAMFRVERKNNANVAYFPADAVFTKTQSGELLVKDSIDPAGVVIANAGSLSVTRVILDGNVAVKPGEALDPRFAGSASLAEILK